MRIHPVRASLISPISTHTSRRKPAAQSTQTRSKSQVHTERLNTEGERGRNTGGAAMSTLPQRFKLLATRCAAGAPSPSRSPAPSYATSPGYRLRCRRGSGRHRGGRLRRFLSRRVGGGPEPAVGQEEDKKPLVGRGSRTLRDLFVASPEGGRRRRGCGCEDDEEEDGGIGSGRAGMAHGGGAGGRRFGSGGLRSLLMRRSWRPVLVAIPESEGKIELGTIEEQ
uniref:Uncharacterized protein n=1 Tax=Avena sativa TaxID=4498 RepID=A0ACD5VUK8_AVESA